MSKSRDIADSAATINYIDNLTSDAQTQLNTLDTAVDNISVTSGTLTKTFAQDEVATITLSSSITTPVVSVTKEVSQTGTTNNTWDVNSTTENYTRLDSAYDTSLSWEGNPNIADTTYLTNRTLTRDTVDLCMNPDGTKFYQVNDWNNEFFEFTMSTAGDISTSSASYTSKFYTNVAGVGNSLRGGFWKNDGTVVYIYSSSEIAQFTASTPFEAGSINSTNTGTRALSSPHFVRMSSDGLKLFYMQSSGALLRQRNLSTAWDISTASASDDATFSLTSEMSSSEALGGLHISEDGLSLYTAEQNTKKIYQWSFGTANDISTLTFVNVITADSSATSVRGIAFNVSSSSFLHSDGSTSPKLYGYSAALNLALGTGSFASTDVGKTIEANSGVFVLTSTAGAYAETTAPTSYAQVASGSWEMYAVVYNTTDGDLQLSGGLLNTGDISTATFNQSEDVSARGTTIIGLTFKPDGTFMYVTFDSNNDGVAFQLTTAWDISTATYATYFGFGGQDTTPAGIAFNNDGTRIYMVGYAGQDINEYDLSTAYSINTATYSRNFSVSSQTTQPYDIKFNSNGTKMFVTDNNSVRVLEYALSEAFRVDNATFTQAFSLSSQMTNAYGLAFNSDGTKMYVSEPNDIFQYTLSTGFDISTASYSGNTVDVSATASIPVGLFLKPDETKIFIAAYNAHNVDDYNLGTEAVLTGYHAVHTTASTDSTYWTDINSMTADEAAGDGSIFYCVSTDDRSTWKIAHNTDGIRSIVRNNSGTWQYNSNSTYASTTWTNATTNTELNALQEAMTGASASVNSMT